MVLNNRLVKLTKAISKIGRQKVGEGQRKNWFIVAEMQQSILRTGDCKYILVQIKFLNIYFKIILQLLMLPL